MFSRYLIFTALLIIVNSAHAKEHRFTMKGNTTDTDSGFVLIRNLTKPLADTVRITNGKFQYSGLLEEVTPHVITDEKNRYQLFFVDPKSTIQMTLNRSAMQIVSIEGSASQEIFKKLLSSQDPLQKEMEQMQQVIRKEGINKDSLQQVALNINERRNENFYNFLKENGHTEVAAFIVFSSISENRGVDAVLADSMFSYLKEKGKSSFYGIETEKSIQKLRAVTIGYEAPDFSLPDSSGTKVYTLSSFRGRYILVDFWASWCGPCKTEIPFLKAAYARFHEKGFDILSVSLDDKREAWTKALQQFQMPWPQVSDVKGFRSIVNDLYPIPSIPKTLLLDRQGKIIATDLRGNALDMKLEELLGR